MEKKEGSFVSFDQSKLFYRQWVPEDNSNDKILILLHRGHEHSGRLDQIAMRDEFSSYNIYSYDNRGHGHTKEKATYEFMNLVRDLDSFIKFVCEKENKPSQHIFIIANSVAGVVASTWVHDYAPNIAGMALVAPAFRIKLYMPFAKQLLKLAIKFKPELNITSYVKSKYLTHNIGEQQRYDSDELITPNIPARQLTTLLDTAERVVNDAHLMAVPTLVLSTSKDYVVDSKVQGDFYANLSSPHKRFVALEGFYHGVLYENNAQQAIDEISSFMNECFNLNETSMLATMVTETQRECDKITYGSLPLHRDLNYKLQKLMMAKLGFMSEGISIGLRYGFDSGVTLDHVYRNEARGTNKFGRFMDRNYLDSIGWKGIRQRKVNSISTIEASIQLLREKGQTARILDIAGGPARYLIELAANNSDIEVRVRDYQQQNIEEGRALAKERNLSNIEYSQTDAFDEESYNREDFSPNIVVVSGVFELFGDNALIEKAIQGITSIIEPDGFLVYTGQPWHPQLEQIAKVLGNHKQDNWVMRRRSQYELDMLFANHGFSKLGMKIDDWGIFTVSVAQFAGNSGNS
jgi:alpha-beta hydrolase superfamily lysophospholipase/SAM-dependent methyltransferase